MLDFDFMCKREKPSVACMVFPFSGNHYIKFYWGTVRNLRETARGHHSFLKNLFMTCNPVTGRFSLGLLSDHS